MKTLDEYNAERIGWFLKMNSSKPVRNGIACPKCGVELFDSDPNATLCTNPPQKAVHCLTCNYHGYRIA